MVWKNTELRYGYVAMMLHWLMGVLIIGMIIVGLYMASLQDGDNKVALYTLHKSFGTIILMLVIARLLWRSNSIIPKLPDNLKPIEIKLAGLTHKFLYVAMFAMPVSGYINTSAGGFKLNFFGFIDIPKVIPVNEFIEILSSAIHTGIAYGLIVLILLHVSAAMRHHFFLKDNILRRMLPTRLR